MNELLTHLCCYFVLTGLCSYHLLIELHAWTHLSFHVNFVFVPTHLGLFMHQWSNLWEKKVCSQIKRDLWGQSSIICLLFATRPLLLMNLIISWLLKAAVKSCFLPTAIWLRAPHISKCKRKKKQRIWKPQGSLIQGQTATNMRCSMSLSTLTCVFCTDFLYVTGPCALLYITT